MTSADGVLTAQFVSHAHEIVGRNVDTVFVTSDASLIRTGWRWLLMLHCLAEVEALITEWLNGLR